MSKKYFPEIYISIPFMLLMAFFYVTDIKSIFVYNILAVLIHESAHIIAAKKCGATISKIEIRAFGIRIFVPELKYISYNKEIIIAIAGPLAGIVAAIMACAMTMIFNICDLRYFIGINLIISAINFIPIYPLDGGRVSQCILCKLFSIQTSYVINKIQTTFIIFSIFIIGIFMAIDNMLNPTLVIFFAYLCLCGAKLQMNS